MLTVVEIIDLLGGPAEFGKICGYSENSSSRGADIRRRGSIPVDYWPAIAEAAFERGIPITYETLVKAHTQTILDGSP